MTRAPVAAPCTLPPSVHVDDGQRDADVDYDAVIADDDVYEYAKELRRVPQPSPA